MIRKKRGSIPLLLLVLALAVGVATLLAAGCGSGGATSTSTSGATTTAAPASSSTSEAGSSTSAASSSTSVASSSSTAAASSTSTSRGPNDLVLASTTSTKDSGLFDVLIPAFSKAFPQYNIKVVAVGSGEALKLGQSGDADVLLVHSPAAEQDFMTKGYGVERKAVMYNDFIIVGPASDPAKIKGMKTAVEAFAAIAKAQAPFFTRGDASGTNAAELALWKKANITPSGSWYIKTGQGMGETLTITDQKNGYTLSDRATYLAKKSSLQLQILVEGDPALFNQYHVITCKAAKNVQGANDFLNWIISPTVQQNVIAPYGKDKFGQSLFVPNAATAK
jgi:tungstate transport system substrate-binding protein